MVDGPLNGVERQPISFRHLKLTNLKVSLPRAAHSKTVKKVWEAENITQKWEATSAAKKIASKKIRAQLNDFQRFKVMVLKQKVSKCILFSSFYNICTNMCFLLAT